MKLIVMCGILAGFLSCDKKVDVALPSYEQELVLEMYLEKGQPLRCLLIESLPYTDTAINKPVNDALVILSDGLKNDTLIYEINQDKRNGRVYNYFNPRLVTAESNKVYYLTIIGNDKKITGTTRFSQRIIPIDNVIVREAPNHPDSFSVGLTFTDPDDRDNYYRVLIGKDINYFRSEPTDFRINDVSFNGKTFSFFSEPDYAKNDTVTIRMYSLSKEHYDYLESMGNARRSNFNPFSQPSRIKSNVVGGLGIFTSILYTEKKVVIKK